jgi:hypothetical protein
MSETLRSPAMALASLILSLNTVLFGAAAALFAPIWDAAPSSSVSQIYRHVNAALCDLSRC